MAATLIPYPPHQPQSAKRISPSAALANISAYLSQSETVPHLHPDAQLHPEAIKFSTTGGPGGGLVLHHVRRVEKGLSGEVLAPEKDELDAIFGGGDDANLDSLAVETELGLNGEPKRKGGLKKRSAYETDLIDAEEWARSQQEISGEVGERDPTSGEVVYGDLDGDAMEIDGGEGAGMTQREKEKRKEEKKRRQKLEKRKKEEEKRGNKG